jgi:hypothetical protein
MPDFPFRNPNTGWILSTLALAVVIGVLFALNPQHARVAQWLGFPS